MTDGRPQGDIILYQPEDGQSRIDVTLSDDTVWLTADQMAELFQRNKSTISRHIRNVFESGELKPDSTVAFFATVQNEGNRKVERNIAYYNLDVIISVGYRVNSHRGVQFRIWATQVTRRGQGVHKQGLFERLFVDGIQIFTKLMSIADKILIRKRAIIETSTTNSRAWSRSNTPDTAPPHSPRTASSQRCG